MDMSQYPSRFELSGVVLNVFQRPVRWRVCEVKEMKVLLDPMFRLVVEGNRVAARQGGKQPETNHQTAGYELDSA